MAGNIIEQYHTNFTNHKDFYFSMGSQHIVLPQTLVCRGYGNTSLFIELENINNKNSLTTCQSPKSRGPFVQ